MMTIPTIHEEAERRDHFLAMFNEICCGDQHALHLCWVVFRWLHVVDDLLDGDHAVTPQGIGLSLIEFTEAVAANPFFQAHRDLLLGVFRASVAAWVDSEAWRKHEDVREKVAAEVMKSQYQDFFYTVASICGGPAHFLSMTEKFRQYQWD